MTAFNPFHFQPNISKAKQIQN